MVEAVTKNKRTGESLYNSKHVNKEKVQKLKPTEAELQLSGYYRTSSRNLLCIKSYTDHRETRTGELAWALRGYVLGTIPW